MPAAASPLPVQPARPSGTEGVPGSKSRLYWLDWIRFLAAFAVLINHTYSYNWTASVHPPDSAHPVLRMAFLSLFALGKQAVVVFFVLSGWLVGGYTIEKLRAGTFDAAAYAADRLARVYVPLIPALAFTAGVAWMLPEPFRAAPYIVSLFSVQNVVGINPPGINSPLWTLVYEAWFYVLAGCAAVAYRRGSGQAQRIVGAAGAALAVGVCCVLGATYLVCWLFGAAGPWLRDRITPATRMRTVAAGVACLVTGTAIFLIDVGVITGVPRVISESLPLPDGAQLIVAIGALLFIASIVPLQPRTPAVHWIERAGVPLAAFSYTLYLTHYPMLCLLRQWFGALPPAHTGHAILRACVWGLVCIVLALGMYAAFERRTPRVRRWLRTRFAGGNAARPGGIALRSAFAVKT